MKVAYVTMLFPAASETFTSNDVRELAAHGLEMSVHSLRPAVGDTERLAGERGVEGVARSYNTGMGSVLAGLRVALRRPHVAIDLLAVLLRRCIKQPLTLVKSLALYPRVLEVFDDLRRRPPDVVHACWSDFPSMVLYLVQRHLPSCVTSISFVAHDILVGYGLSGTVGRRADLVRTVARVNVRQVEERFGVPAASIEVIVDGLDLGLLPPPAERTPRSVVTAGRLVEQKGTDQVLRVFARIHRRWPDATLRVLGSGPLLPQLQGLAAELGVTNAVTFAGHVAQRGVLEEMRRAEVFLFLSETSYDRLPNVVKEAMLCGCACIASDTEGIEELIEHGKNGFVVARGDLDAAERHLVDVFGGRVKVGALTRAAEVAMRDAFDLQASVRRYQARWAELVALRRHGRSDALPGTGG